jgi:hypothetical protein
MSFYHRICPKIPQNLLPRQIFSQPTLATRVAVRNAARESLSIKKHFGVHRSEESPRVSREKTAAKQQQIMQRFFLSANENG